MRWLFNLSSKLTVAASNDPEVPLANQKSVSAPDIKTDFVEFVTEMKNKYGSRATAIACNLFAQEGGKRGERVVYQRDYNLISMSIVPVAFSIYTVHTCLQLNGYDSELIFIVYPLMQILYSCCFGVSEYRARLWRRYKISSKPIMSSNKDPEVPLVTQKSISEQDITLEFEEFEARMKEKYGEKKTAATMKSFAQGAQEEGEFYREERSYFTNALSLTSWLPLFIFWIYQWLLQRGHDFPLIAYFSICCHLLGLYYHGVNIYHKRYSKLFSLSSYSIVIFIIISVFATHLLTFYFSWSRVQHSQ